MTLRCLVGRHEPLLTQKRDAAGQVVKPHVVVWECRHCRRPLGETVLTPRWTLLARIRRQKARKVA